MIVPLYRRKFSDGPIILVFLSYDDSRHIYRPTDKNVISVLEDLKTSKHVEIFI